MKQRGPLDFESRDAWAQRWKEDRDVRRVGRVLSTRGHYEETPDDFHWLMLDSIYVVEAWEHDASPEAVAGALMFTGIHCDGLHVETFDSIADRWCFRGDVEAIVEALGG